METSRFLVSFQKKLAKNDFLMEGEGCETIEYNRWVKWYAGKDKMRVKVALLFGEAISSTSDKRIILVK